MDLWKEMDWSDSGIKHNHNVGRPTKLQKSRCDIQNCFIGDDVGRTSHVHKKKSHEHHADT